MEVNCYLMAKKVIELILLFVFDKNLAGFVTFYFVLRLILAYSNTVRTYEMSVYWDLKSKMYLDSVCLSDHFRIEMSRVIGTTMSAVSPMERDKFTA